KSFTPSSSLGAAFINPSHRKFSPIIRNPEMFFLVFKKIFIRCREVFGHSKQCDTSCELWQKLISMIKYS
ncbi:MAG: hypothetical protein IJQ15_04065, partial [Synergistaceae bacterium]|nr:hypothetical protein [Synergistaceae bacterium]